MGSPAATRGRSRVAAAKSKRTVWSSSATAAVIVPDGCSDIGVALGLQDIEAEDCIGGCDRAAVGEPGFGAHAKRHRAAVCRKLGGVGDQAVDGIGLIERARHQAIEQQIEPLGRVALQDEAVEAVEGGARGGSDHRQAAAFRRIRVDPLEVLEVGRILELAERREAVSLTFRGRCADPEGNEQDCRGAYTEHLRRHSFSHSA